MAPACLPLALKFRLAQMEYNILHPNSIPFHLALRDYLKVALPISYGEWDSKKLEKGGHRSNDDGYRRERYLMIIEKCLKCADRFNRFRGIDSIYHEYSNESEQKNENGSATTTTQTLSKPKKRRKICTSISEPTEGSLGSDLIAISQVFFRLRAAKKAEEKKSRAPPPLLSFGSSNVR
jgi:hypothetical protein